MPKKQNIKKEEAFNPDKPDSAYDADEANLIAPIIADTDPMPLASPLVIMPIGISLE